MAWWRDLKINTLEIAQGAGNAALHALTWPIEQHAAAQHGFRQRARDLAENA
jgi:hypothetical protein